MHACFRPWLKASRLAGGPSGYRRDAPNRDAPATTEAVVLIGAFGLLSAAMSAAAGQPPKSPPSGWPPVVHYSLGNPPPILPLIDGQEQITVIGQRRAPTPHLTGPDTTTAQSVFNIGGPPLRAPANCNQNYTTVAGQPARAADVSGAVGVRSCYF